MASRVPVASGLRSQEPTAYDAARYSDVVDWTSTSILLRGKPVTLVSAEFQYFRVPDRERWRPLLLDIKSMGFNAVRLYIHWGYHSPAEGVYNFRGNRDIDYLLRICAELQLFVIVAPGPYICAEVQAGGFPIWLIAKRELRVRHLTMPPLGLVKRWDDNFHNYCVDYMRKVLPMLIKYELTTNPNGCVIAMQIENELREPPFIGFGGLDDEIRLLCKLARECGSTVPLFHNDDSPIGSWSRGGDYRSLKKGGAKTGVKAYRTDLYGFDLYFTFPPGDRSGDLSSMQVGMIEACGTSACLNCCGIGGTGVGGSDTQCLSCLYDAGQRYAPPPPLAWSTANQMERAVDTLGKKLYGFGGSARHAPAFVAETQVGWINQWGRFRTYDDVYNFFGDQFSSTLQLSLLAQGVTFANHYIAYGGTNHGTVGDTEVYTSYDYSAFIREYGFLSGRGRVLRQALLFARSFADYGFSDTMASPSSTPGKARASAKIKATVPAALIAVRQVVQDSRRAQDQVMGGAPSAQYAFLRNLKEERLRCNLLVDNVVLPCILKKCEGMVAPLYHSLQGSGISIFACTVPVLCRTSYQGSELWVLRVRSDEVGRLVLKAEGKDGIGRQGVAAKWATLTSHEHESNTPTGGEAIATDQDPGAATSLLSAPLEELSLASQNSLGQSRDPFAVRASTEEIGLCFSFSFKVQKSVAMIINDLSESGTSSPILRLICLNEHDAATFTADLNGNDVFTTEPKINGFSAAWGVSNLAFDSSSCLTAGFGPRDDKATLFALLERGHGAIPEQFQSCPSALTALLPGLMMHQVPENSLMTALSQGIDSGDPLSVRYEIPVTNWSQRIVDWTEDVVWKRISYENRDPLDHFMTSGHIAYRLRFRSSSQKGALTTNIRHSAVIWCNGHAVGSQICFSHNIMSAGAMHGVDLHHAGKKRHDLTRAMENGPDGNGFHEVIILVLSLGQSRSPFLLNDVRNKRGLLSARLSRGAKVSDVSWEISGVDVTRTDDAYGTSGLPLEDDVNASAYDVGFTNSPGLALKANNGIVYFRGFFRVPPSAVVGGSTRYPLRIKISSGANVSVMLWVNTLFMGRYVEALGPQCNFYVPEGLIKLYKGNTIVVATYGPVDANLSVQILPWVVDCASGNLDEESGHVYALRLARFNLDGSKGKHAQ